MATPKTPQKGTDTPTQNAGADAPKTVSETPVNVAAAAAKAAAPVTGTAKDTAKDAVKDVAKDAAPKPTATAKDAAKDTPFAQSTPALDKPKAAKSEMAVEDAVILDKPATKAKAEPAASEPRISAPAAAVPPTIVKASPGFVPLVLGGVVAAGLGFALARFVVPEGWPVPGSSPVQAQLTQQAEEIKSLRAELQALPKEDGANALMAELGAVRDTATAALDAAEAAKASAAAVPQASPAEDVTLRFTALEDRLAAIEQRPVGASTVDPAVISQLTAEIDTLRNGLEAQKTAAEKLVSEAEAVRADAATKAQSVLLQAALTKVEASMLDGVPFVEPLALLADAGLAIPAILTDNSEKGLPTLAALETGFDEPARAALEESLRGNMGSTWSDRVGSFLRSQTGARSLTPKEGDDPDAILSRANAAVVAGDLPTALTEIATLPEAAQTALADWVNQANLRIDAQAATVALAAALSER